jgi:hypothetical protein
MDDRTRAIFEEAFDTLDRLEDLKVSEPDTSQPDSLESWAAGMPQPEPPPRKRGLDTTVEQSTDWSGWERWLRSRLDAERAFLLEVVGNAIAEIVHKQHKVSKLLALAGEVIE